MKMKKLIGAAALSLLSVTALASCGGGNGEKIVVWTFSNELKEIVKNYYGEDKATVQVKASVTQVKDDLSNAQKSGKKIPDVVALEAAVIADYTSKSSDNAALETLDDIEGTDQMYAYTKSVASSTDGKVLGLSWQATPGGFFYKESIAKKLGINSVEEMEAKISTWEGYLDLARQAHEYDLNPDVDGKQSIAICSSITDPVKVFLSAREKSWVEDNTLQMEEVMFGGGSNQYNCFNVVRTLQQEGYTHESSDRGPGWVSDIDSANTLGYFCSSWGLNFDLMPNAKTSKGDWKMCKAPVDYFKGGTWLAVPKGSTKVAQAKDFIKYVTTNQDFLLQRGKNTGDFMNNKTVMTELVKNYTCEFLGGQNHLAKLYEVAEKINGNLISPYDATIDSVFTTTVANFARDEAETPAEVELAREDQKDKFIVGVSSKFPTIIVPQE